ncbi:MAG: STAS domain-containing protein [Bryobacteraceae bacterium]
MVDRNETRWLFRWEGDCTISSAAELKLALVEGLASGQPLELDLERAGQIDISFLQLLWSAEREAARAGLGFVSRVPESAAAAARVAGFERFPGEQA